MELETPEWEQVVSDLQPLCSCLRRCNDPALHRDLTLAVYFLMAITGAYRGHYALGITLPRRNPQWQEWLEKLRLPKEADFTSLHDQRREPGNGERLTAALLALEAANSPHLAGVSQAISWCSPRLGREQERDDLLAELIGAASTSMAAIYPGRTGALHYLPQGFTHLLNSFASLYGKKTRDIVPTWELAHLLSGLVNPRPGDEICDPNCTTGSLLTIFRDNYSLLPHYNLFGQEGNPGSWALARMNLFLHGMYCRQVELGNTISDPKLRTDSGDLQQFDILVSNLLTVPDDWGVEQAASDPFSRFTRGVPQKAKGEYGYIQHMIACMKPKTGRMAVIVPRGVLFRGGTEADIRRRLIDDDLLVGVIGLPERLCYGTLIPVVVLLLSVNKSEPGTVIFIDASHDFQSGKNRNSLRRGDFERIYMTYHGMRDIEGYSHVATREEIAGNDYNLNVPRYVGVAEKEPLNLEQIEHHREELWTELMRLDREIGQLMKANRGCSEGS